MSAGKEQNIGRHCPHAAYYAIGACRHFLRRFAVRVAIAEQPPVRTFSKNVYRKAALVFAVVPFDEVAISFSYGLESGQFAGPYGSPQRTGEYFCEEIGRASCRER